MQGSYNGIRCFPAGGISYLAHHYTQNRKHKNHRVPNAASLKSLSNPIGNRRFEVYKSYVKSECTYLCACKAAPSKLSEPKQGQSPTLISTTSVSDGISRIADRRGSAKLLARRFMFSRRSVLSGGASSFTGSPRCQEIISCTV